MQTFYMHSQTRVHCPASALITAPDPTRFNSTASFVKSDHTSNHSTSGTMMTITAQTTKFDKVFVQFLPVTEYGTFQKFYNWLKAS